LVIRRPVVAAALAVTLCGCATYTTPGGGASIAALVATEDSAKPQAVSGPEIAAALARRPAATFPAHLTVARVQGAGYETLSNRGYGSGRFSVVTSRDIETEEDFMRLARMPGVAAVGPINRLLLPSVLETAEDLRTAAAQLQGDVLLIYTLDTSFRADAHEIGPLQVVSLGFLRNQNSVVTSTCAAAFIDVRTGYVYGIAEFTATEERRSNVWSTHDAVEAARGKAEREAFAAALGEIEKAWSGIHAEHAHVN
jgi:hypothetical protein